MQWDRMEEEFIMVLLAREKQCSLHFGLWFIRLLYLGFKMLRSSCDFVTEVNIE